MMVVVREQGLAWLGIVCVVVEGLDSVSLNSGNSFLPGDSRNHSGGIRIPFKIPSESFDQFGRPLCQI